MIQRSDEKKHSVDDGPVSQISVVGGAMSRGWGEEWCWEWCGGGAWSLESVGTLDQSTRTGYNSCEDQAGAPPRRSQWSGVAIATMISVLWNGAK